MIVNGLLFKDLNRNGSLDPYEDWRLPVDERAADLAHRLSVEEITGLMLYSGHQSIPARPDGYFAGTYKGKPFAKGETDPSDLTDQQQKFLKEDNLRHVLITSVQTPAIAAQWNNKLQAYCESLGKGIPANNSSDPRRIQRSSGWAHLRMAVIAGDGRHVRPGVGGAIWPNRRRRIPGFGHHHGPLATSRYGHRTPLEPF